MKLKLIPCFFILGLPLAASAQQGNSSISYTLAQAEAGREIYGRECTLCHGAALEGAEGGPALVGPAFADKWRSQSLLDFYNLTRNTMPVTKPAGLTTREYENVVAYILNRNSFASGRTAFAAGNENLTAVPFAVPNATNVEALAESTDPSGLTQEWLHHRGTPGSLNYSSLDLINRGKRRRSAGRLALALGQFRPCFVAKPANDAVDGKRCAVCNGRIASRRRRHRRKHGRNPVDVSNRRR